ncbi:hypothetical protein ALP18_200211 [Pseudomonas amygdali pv. myricae]|nr:hypothetical protein ALP18_200211 [Pseudomonas amygdali pv. myricae]
MLLSGTVLFAGKRRCRFTNCRNQKAPLAGGAFWTILNRPFEKADHLFNTHNVS